MRISPKSQVMGAASIGILNQIIGSATNFGISIYLVRTLDAAGFGLWGLAFSIVLLILGLANGLILTQMVVGLPRRPRWSRPAYIRSMLIGTLIAGIGIFAVAGLLAALFSGNGLRLTVSVASLSRFILATGLAAACVITLHFYLRLAFSINRESVAVFLNIILLGSLMLLLGLSHWHTDAMTASLAMMLYGLAHLIAAIAGSWLLPVHRRHFKFRMLVRDLSDAWQQGRWAMAGVWVSWGQSQAYVYLTPFFFGLAGLGAVNAARMIASPLIMLIPAVNQVALPRFSKMRVDQPDRMARSGLRLAALLIGGATLYAVAVGGMFDWISQLLLGQVRPELFWVALAWCLMAGLSLVRQIATVMMQSARKFFALFAIESIVLSVTVAAMFLLFGSFGWIGGVLATALGEALIAALIWRNFLTDRPVLEPLRTN